jgi:hypothetical protein
MHGHFFNKGLICDRNECLDVTGLVMTLKLSIQIVRKLLHQYDLVKSGFGGAFAWAR